MTNANQEVLAKSEPPISLEQHIEDCLSVFNSMVFAFERLPVNDIRHFWDIVRISIIYHDLGKTHSEFQKVLQGMRANWYHQRHEVFSSTLIDFLNISEIDKFLLKLIVIGHHKDIRFLLNQLDNGYKDDDDIFSLSDEGKLEWIEESQKLNLTYIERLLKKYNISCNLNSLELPKNFLKNYTNYPINARDILFNELILAAGALKQCDHLASAGIFKINLLKDSNFNFLYNKAWNPYSHQIKASNSNGNIVLTAPTGAGKTEASLMWLHNQIKKLGQGRVFYILPFTASINAMYERLDKEMIGNNEIVGVIHGKLSEYIESRFGDEKYSWQNEKLKKELKESFKALVTPLKVTTPFQLLKSIFGLRGFEKGIFEMSGGYFIFDEIHAYEPEVLAQIKVLIEFAVKYLNVQVCLMTATLPGFLKQILVESLDNYTEIVADRSLYKSFQRHRIKIRGGLLENHLNEIQKRLDVGDKVLVVCNRVSQAQSVYNSLNSDNKVLLHSAFNGMDRNEKEARLKETGTKLLVGTQAIEVSLDIDYDVIFTEPAPLDALLQRFGRVNRHRINGVYRPPCDCIVFSDRNENDKFIYKYEDVITRTLAVLSEIEACNLGIVDESVLQKYIDIVYPCWSKAEKDDYECVYNQLKSDVVNNLSPFIYDLHREEEFEKQFDGIKVLPSIQKNKYIEYVEANQFIKAESLKVAITKRRFFSLINNGGLHQYIATYENLKKNTLQDLKFYIIDRKYDNELGLQLDIEVKADTDFII